MLYYHFCFNNVITKPCCFQYGIVTIMVFRSNCSSLKGGPGVSVKSRIKTSYIMTIQIIKW